MLRLLLLFCLVTAAVFALGTLLIFLTGCADINGAVQRAVVGVDCRHLLPDGQCTPVRKGQ